MKHVRSFAAAALFGAVIGGCGVESAAEGTPSGGVTDNGKTIASVDINPNQLAIGTGKTQQFHAVVRYADGTTKDITNDVVWNTSDPSVATVGQDGTVTTQKAGVVDITAEYKGVKGSQHFAVAG